MTKSNFLSNEFISSTLSGSEVRCVVLLPHRFPDGDTLGSAIAMVELIKSYGKKGYIVLDDDIPSNLRFLFDQTDYLMKSSEWNESEIDLCIAVDCGESKLFEDRMSFFERAEATWVIDHHQTNSQYGQFNRVDVTASSTGEMVAELYEDLGISHTPKSAEALYTAIVMDTGSFRYSNTTQKTFETVSKLRAVDFDFNRLNVELFQNKPINNIKILHATLNTLRFHADGRIAVVDLSAHVLEKLGFSDYDTDGIIDFVRDIKGVEVVVFMRYIGEGFHKVSLRSKYDFDVSKVAEGFSGGGHKKAAGFKSSDCIAEIENKLVIIIEEAI